MQQWEATPRAGKRTAPAPATASHLLTDSPASRSKPAARKTSATSCRVGGGVQWCEWAGGQSPSRQAGNAEQTAAAAAGAAARRRTEHRQRADSICSMPPTHPQRLERLALLHEGVGLGKCGVHLARPHEAGRRVHGGVGR